MAEVVGKAEKGPRGQHQALRRERVGEVIRHVVELRAERVCACMMRRPATVTHGHFPGRSQLLHVNSGAAWPGSTITAPYSPQRPHCRTSFVGSLTIGLLDCATAWAPAARSSALLCCGRRCFMRRAKVAGARSASPGLRPRSLSLHEPAYWPSVPDHRYGRRGACHVIDRRQKPANDGTPPHGVGARIGRNNEAYFATSKQIRNRQERRRRGCR